MPHLLDLYQKHRNRGLKLVLISQEPLDLLRLFARVNDLAVPVLSDPEGVAFGPYGASEIPRTVLVDRQGNLAAVLPGYQEEAFTKQFVPMVEKALGIAKEARLSSGRSPATKTMERTGCRGVFGSPQPLWDLGITLREAGIDAVFVGHGALDRETVARCRREGARVYAEFGLFQGKKIAEARPELWPIGADGQRLKPQNWYLGLCPDQDAFRKEKLAELAEVVRKFDVDGVWLDFIRYPGHWEVRAPRLPHSCFCDRSLARFARAARLKLPEGDTAARAAWILTEHADAWTRWKCAQIADFARDARRIVKAVRPDALLGAFVVPWRPDEHDGAIRTILGQDYARLARHIDVFSPMVYHRMVGRPADWVGEFAAYTRAATRRPAWPIVQAVDAPPGERLGTEELAAALQQSLTHGDGAIVFTLQALLESPEKLEATRRSYRPPAAPEPRA